MPEYLAPGVYVEEVDTGAKPIEGVSTSTSGMVGVTERGPVGVPTLVTSFPDFTRQFGGYLDDRVYTGTTWYLPHAVEGFFTNGGKRVYIVRVLPPTATTARITLFDRGDTADAAGVTFTRFTLALGSRVGRGDQLLLLTDTAGLSPAGGDWALIQDGRASEYVQLTPAPTGVIAISTPVRASLFLKGTPVIGLDLANAQVGQSHLAADVVQGAFVLPVENPGIFVGPVRYRIGAAPIQEVHDVARNGVVAVSVPLALEHTSTPVVRPDEWADPAKRSLTAPAPQISTITLDNRTLLAGAGQRLRLTNADGVTEVARIASIALPRVHPGADPGQVTLEANLQHNYDAGDKVELLDPPPWTDPVSRRLTVVPPAVATTVDLNNRTLLLGAGQRIQITNRTTPGSQEVTVTAIPGPRAPAPNPDPGQVTLGGAGLTLPMAPADDVIAELLDPPPTLVVQPTLNLIAGARALTRRVPKGATQVTLDNRFGIPDPAPGTVQLLKFTAGGRSEFARIAAIAAPRGASPDPGVVTLATPLQRAYSGGTAVTAHTDANADANPTSLAWDVSPGDGALVLNDSTAYAPGTAVRIREFAATDAEYAEIPAAGPTPAFRVITAPLRWAHAAAVPVLGRSALLTVAAIDPGTWGNLLRVVVDREGTPRLRETSPAIAAPATSPTVTLNTAVGIEPGSILEFFTRDALGHETVAFQQKVASVQGGNKIGFGPGGVAQAVTPAMFVRTVEFEMRVGLVRINPRTQQEEVAVEEQFRQLSMDPRHSRYVVRVIGPIFINDIATPRGADGRTAGESGLIRIRDTLYPNWPQDDPLAILETQGTLRTGPDILLAVSPGGPPRTIGLLFTGGNDDIGSVGPATYVGTEGANPPQSRTGIFALKNIEEIAIVGVPGQTGQSVQEALLVHCALMRYRFAVLDSAQHLGIAKVEDQRSLYDSKYGALYYPWAQIANPFPDNPRFVSQISIPASGHVMGIYARSDIERGVHKAPANEDVRGILDLEVSLTKEEQDILNPRNINVVRNFRSLNRALRVWGARTLSSDPDWKYVNVRRVFIFVEHSIDRGTQWVVFEPNDERLWARVRRSVTDFLTTVWRNGALQGVKPEEGFFVKCDRETMTEDDINNGRLIVLVGLAVVRPAEFVIFRIGQSRRGAQLFEGA